MTGLYSEHNGVNSLQSVELRDDLSTLAEKFSEAGYTTHGEVTGPISEETGLDRGFDVYNYRDKDQGLLTEWGDQIHNTVANLEEPFFFYLHLWELHDPISTPNRFNSTKYGSTSYARMFSALDRELEKLVQSLPEDTTLCLLGDHGESITYRDSRFRRSLKLVRDNLRYRFGLDTRPVERMINRLAPENRMRDHFIEIGHGENFFDFTSNVPFLIANDKVEHLTVSEQVRQIDIYPTILDLAGIPIDEDLDSETLLPPRDLSSRSAYLRACGESLYGEESWARGIRANGLKYIEYPNRDWEPELYDLESDPMELSPIDDEHRENEMKELLPEEGLQDSKTIDIQDRLKDLGYL
jgi:arylsulfatase A-like enzyme